MPFMAGRAPIRRTKQYLESGKIIFRESVKIFTIYYKEEENSSHAGARDFDFWHMPQIQYKNPKVQCLTFKHLTPTPFIRIFLENNKEILIDLDNKGKQEILRHLENFTAVCKTKEEISSMKNTKERISSPSYFGFECERHCICEVPGQVPCSGIIPIPSLWKGQDTWGKIRKFRIPHAFIEPGLEECKKEES